MGCRHCFVVDLVEEIVGEGGSRSSQRVREHDSYQLVSQQNVAIRVFWTPSTSFNIERSWVASRQTTGLSVQSWFTYSSKKRFWPWREKRGWDSCSHQTTFERSWFSSRQTTGLPVLSWFTASSREERVSISWERGAPLWGETTGLTVLSWSRFGFGWFNWELLDCWATSSSGCRATSAPNSFIQSCFKEILEEAEETHIFSRIWLLQFPPEQLSGYNKTRVFREEWWRSIVSDRTSILFSEQGWCRPNTPCFDVSSTLCACTVQDAVLPGRSSQDPCGLCPWDSQAEKNCLSVAQIVSSRYQSWIDDGM